MHYNKYRVTWIDDGDEEIARFDTREPATSWRDFLESCARYDGHIREIKLIICN